MRFRRTPLIMVLACVLLISAVAGLVVRQAQGEDVESTLWVHAVLIFVGLLMLARATIGPSAQLIRDRCTRCGGPTFETARSQDRKHVRTCFTCGNEDPNPLLADPLPSTDPPSPKHPEKAGPEY